MSNPPVDVQEYGQSIWMDNIRRKLLKDGTFENFINEQGVVGVTSNPAIFQKAIGQSDDYDNEIRVMMDLTPEQIYEQLAIEDIQLASDLFRPVYDRTGGRDGYVSLEVSPQLAHDTDGTLAEAKRLFAAVNRPNVMIKIPATPAGIPAIEASIAAGINVNVTLIFAVDNYVQVAEAYMRGLEKRMAAGEDVTRIASVASFFLSRIDTMVDRILENNIHAAKMQGDVGRIQANNRLLGKAAIANAKLAYKRFRDMFYGERFASLREAGAAVQRPLWASTSAKNPAYPDTMYVDSLIGKDTVNTLPPETLVAFSDHGTVARETLLDEINEVEIILDMLAEVGVDMAQVTQRLQDDGVEAFAQAFEDLMTQVSAKASILQTGVLDRQDLALGIYGDVVQDTISRLKENYFNSRLWNHDGSLWKDNSAVIVDIENRLGWLDVQKTIDLDRLKALRNDITGAGFKHVVLLGMGGSSLAPEVMARAFGQQPGFPALLVLDNTHPTQVQYIDETIDINRTLFVVASKSGSTIETHTFFKYFYERAERNGAQFIAITDPGSSLQKLAEEQNFRDVFLNPADIGGRYSALSYFGMVPAALMGLDLDRLWGSAQNMMKACADYVPEDRNPGAILGAVLGALGKEGRDKICIFGSPSLGNFGDWVEQLVAESTGKEGKGLVPVVGTSIGRPHDYDSDRILVYLKVEDDISNIQMDGKVRALREAGHPRVRLLLADPYQLGGEFFRWEYATAVAGHLLGINPFDEPNVTESKQNTSRLLKYHQEHGELPQSTPVVAGRHLDLFIGQRTLEPLYDLCRAHNFRSDSRTELMAAQLIGTRASDYLAILAYVPTHPEIVTTLEHIARRLRHVTRRAVTVGYGPRYLHSTGQLHKGGPNNGVFLQITAELDEDVAIPGMPYSFGTLNMAQAAGDLEALQNHNRRVLRLHVKGDVIAGINRLMAAIDLVDERRQ